MYGLPILLYTDRKDVLLFLTRALNLNKGPDCPALGQVE